MRKRIFPRILTENLGEDLTDFFPRILTENLGEDLTDFFHKIFSVLVVSYYKLLSYTHFVEVGNE